MPAGDNSVAVPCAVPSTASEVPDRSRTNGGAKSQRAWLYRRIMKSSVVEPFRTVLRPLIRWTWKPHFGVRDAGAGMVPVNLKPPSAFAILMSVILAPIVFLMLLPLLLILVPVVMFVGVIAIIVPVLQGDMEEGEHHSFASHVVQ